MKEPAFPPDPTAPGTLYRTNTIVYCRRDLDQSVVTYMHPGTPLIVLGVDDLEISNSKLLRILTPGGLRWMAIGALYALDWVEGE